MYTILFVFLSSTPFFVHGMEPKSASSSSTSAQQNAVHDTSEEQDLTFGELMPYLRVSLMQTRETINALVACAQRHKNRMAAIRNTDSLCQLGGIGSIITDEQKPHLDMVHESLQGFVASYSAMGEIAAVYEKSFGRDKLIKSAALCDDVAKHIDELKKNGVFDALSGEGHAVQDNVAAENELLKLQRTRHIEDIMKRLIKASVEDADEKKSK